MMLRSVAIFTVILCGALRAETIGVLIDTSSHSGEKGGIYFQFAPGLNADPASVAITNFQIGAPGTLLPASPLNFSTGGASGSLDADNLLITNDFALNDYGESLMFGDFISFLVTLNLPAVLVGDSGSELFLQITGPDLLTSILTADPDGKLVILAYDEAGAINAASTSPSASVSQISDVPEPQTLTLLAVSLAICIFYFQNACHPSSMGRAGDGFRRKSSSISSLVSTSRT